MTVHWHPLTRSLISKSMQTKHFILFEKKTSKNNELHKKPEEKKIEKKRQDKTKPKQATLF